MSRCEQCGKQVEADTLAAEAAAQPADAQGGRERCPSCGTELAGESEALEEEVHPRAPWHFKVLVVGSVGYLGYRLYQGIGWLIHHA